MEIRTLQYFLAVAREQNMTEAANLLFVTQPTLSRQMADLEKELGKKLFIRSNRSTTLTEEGMHLRQRAEEILSLVEQTKSEIKDEDLDLTGCIRIGAGITYLAHYLTDTFSELRKENPHLTIEMLTGNADTVQEKLEHGLLDFGLFIQPFNVENYNYLELPGKNRLGIVTSIHSPWAKLDAVTPEDILGIPLMTSSRHNNRSFDLESWSRGKISMEKLNIVGTMDLSCNVNPLILQQTANVLCLNRLEHHNSPELKFIPLEPAYEVSSLVVWKKYRLLSHSSQVFLERLKQRIEEETSKNEV